MMVAWITVIHQIGGAAAAYLGGVLRIGFGTYLEAFVISGLMCIGAALMVLFIGAGARSAGASRSRRAVAGRVAAGKAGTAPVRGSDGSAGANHALITASIMLATIMQGVDNTIANVALPHMQGSMSATQDQIAWVLTSYMVSTAIMMPLTGWLTGQFGIKYVFLVSVLGFTVFSALAGSGDEPDADRDLPHRAGDLRRRAGAAVAIDAAVDQSAGAARAGDGDVGHGGHARADHGTGDRRMAERKLRLAMDFLHQFAAWPDRRDRYYAVHPV